MVATAVLLIISLLCWAMTVICLRGVDWILISGVNTLPKAERQKYKEKHDMVAMNKFIGKKVFLPLAIICTITAVVILLDAPWMQTPWFAAVIIVACVALLAITFWAAAKIFGGNFS